MHLPSLRDFGKKERAAGKAGVVTLGLDRPSGHEFGLEGELGGQLCCTSRLGV